MSDTDVALFTYPNDVPFADIDCSEAFKALSTKEKLYAHYLSQASWYGGLICLLQTSPESPLIFSLLHKLIKAESLEGFKKRAVEEGNATNEDIKALLVYISAVFSNQGNYKGFGDSKIIPNFPKSSFEQIVKTSAAFKAEPKVVQSLWNLCSAGMYSLDPLQLILGFSDTGVTKYFTPNCTNEDSKIVGNFLKKKNMDAYNSRVFKYEEEGKTVYEIRMASVLGNEEKESFMVSETFEGHQFKITRGDYGPLLDIVCQNLEHAKAHVSNDLEKQMIDQYIVSFRTGSLDAHKDGSRFWIKNKGPVIETYIGFIETYRDPAGMRGEFEGFVALVNKEMSLKFQSLVDNSESLLKELPWPSTFEKDTFLKPDFTSLDVLTFSGSGVPAGINIPNYDEIRHSEGFKNVSLGNVIHSGYKSNKPQFVSEKDKSLMEKYAVSSFEVVVGLHELLGHGSGKLFRKEGDKFNFDTKSVINPLTDEKITSWYEEGESYDSKFTALGSAYEECRAECVALYLSLNDNVMKIFGFEGPAAEEVTYVCWLSMLWNGAAKAPELYSLASKKWLQSHAQARFVILSVCLEAGEGLVTVEETDSGKNLLLKLDESKIRTVGKKAIGDFLLKLQVFKSTGDVQSAQALFDKYSEVSENGPYPWAKWHSIVLAHKQPRKILVQHNTKLNGDSVELLSYPVSVEGYVQSWIDRFSSHDIDDVLETLWEKDSMHFSADFPEKASNVC